MSKSNLLKTLGIIFLALGIWGFINDPIAGIFEVNTMHNIVHLLLGGIALYYGFDEDRVETGGKILTVLNAFLIVSMLIKSEGNVLGIEVNPADHLLHLPFLLASVYVGFLNPEKRASVHRA